MKEMSLPPDLLLVVLLDKERPDPRRGRTTMDSRPARAANCSATRRSRTAPALHDGDVQLVFMYGAGRDGRGGWPPAFAASGDHCTFMKRLPHHLGDDPLVDCERLSSIARRSPIDLIGVSYGGVAALLTARRVPHRIRSLTLFEPSCADLAREAASVTAFRNTLEPVFSVRNDQRVSDADFLAMFVTAMQRVAPGDQIDPPDVKQLRHTPPPWEIDIPRGRLEVPTLVVTGGWSGYFEDIAAALVRDGATHKSLPGYGHWVPQHPLAAPLLRQFTKSRLD